MHEERGASYSEELVAQRMPPRLPMFFFMLPATAEVCFSNR